MNGLSNLDEIYREYSLAPTDDLIRFWRSKVKVLDAVEVAKASTSTLRGLFHSTLCVYNTTVRRLY